MGNKRKPRNPRLRALGQRLTAKIDIPEQMKEKIVSRTVPAVIHWDTVSGSPRTDDETIGEAVHYEDGTVDIAMYEDISDDAKKMIYGAQAGVDHFSLLKPEEN
jgi:hypothetical protein